MKCSLTGCPGEYEPQAITHTVRHAGRPYVVDHVPADVCSVCGDTLLSLAAAERIDEIVPGDARPAASIPLFEYGTPPLTSSRAVA